MPVLFSRTISCLALLLMASVSSAQTLPATAPAETSADYGPILQLLHDRDATLTDFTANIKKEDYKLRTAETETRTGSVNYLKDAGITKIAIHFDQYFPPDLPPKKLNQDLIFDGQFGIDREDNPGTSSKIFRKQEFVAAGDVGKVNPLKLGEGPFAESLPLPIGQDPREITRNFTVALLPLDPKTDLKPLSGKPEDLVHLQLVPKVKEEFTFSKLDMFVDLSPSVQLPLRIIILNRDNNMTTIDLTEIKTNRGGAPASIFVVSTPAAGSGWTVTLIPYKK